MLEFGHAVLQAQPSAACSAPNLSHSHKEVRNWRSIRPDHLQQHGFAHGGVISYLAHNALTFAGGSVLADSVTREYKISYLRPAIGQRLIGRASVTGSGKSQAVCHCDVFVVADGTEKMCATAQGTIRKAG